MTLRTTLYDASGTDREVALSVGVASKLGPKQLLWVDLDGRETTAIERLGEALELPEDAVKHLLESPGAARLLRYPGLVHLRLVAIQPADPDARDSRHGPSLQSSAIDIVAGPNMVVTVHDGAVHAFDAFVACPRGLAPGRARRGKLHGRAGRFGVVGLPGDRRDDRASHRRPG